MNKKRAILPFLFLVSVLLSAFLFSIRHWAFAQTSDQGLETDPKVTFVDVTMESGVQFLHDNAVSKEKYLVETMGSGCAFLDFDQDGFLDIFFVNGGPTPA